MKKNNQYTNFEFWFLIDPVCDIHTRHSIQYHYSMLYFLCHKKLSVFASGISKTCKWNVWQSFSDKTNYKTHFRLKPCNLSWNRLQYETHKSIYALSNVTMIRICMAKHAACSMGRYCWFWVWPTCGLQTVLLLLLLVVFSWVPNYCVTVPGVHTNHVILLWYVTMPC